MLGPKLFIFYINDIRMVSKTLKLVLLADDSNIFGLGENLQQLLEVITAEKVAL